MQPCEPGFACVGGLRTACIEGSSYQNAISGSSCHTCSTCPAGKYKTSDCTTTTDTICEPCPPGFACLENVKTSCVTSTYQPNSTKSSCLTCSTCPAGSYMTSTCTSTSDTVCEPCPPGSACLENVKTNCVAKSTFQSESKKVRTEQV